MKIAVFSDIHANIYAFRAALADAAACDVTDYFFLGDVITDLPWPNEVIDTIRSLPNVKAIRGNREQGLKALENDSTLTEYHQYASLYRTYEFLSTENRAYIASWPDSLAVNLNGTDFFLHHKPEDIWGANVNTLRHSTVGSLAEYANLSRKILCKHQSAMAPGVYLYGHFHGQWHDRVGDVLAVNPGSCGQAALGETRGTYSILSVHDGQWNVDERQVEYDRARTLRELRASAMYRVSPIWSEVVSIIIESGNDVLPDFFAHMNQACADRGITSRPYPNDIWDIEGRRWLEQIRNKIAECRN